MPLNKKLLSRVFGSLCISFCFSILSSVKAQDTDSLIEEYFISRSDSFVQLGQIKNAIKLSREICLAQPNNYIEIYNYSALLSKDLQIDSAFKYLQIALDHVNWLFPCTEPDYYYLFTDKRWKKVEEECVKREIIKNKIYAKGLWKIMAIDQLYYEEINVVEELIGYQSSVINALQYIKGKNQKQNEFILEKLISKYGWPKQSKVGKRATTAAFFVIQHSELSIQKRYINRIKKMCLIGENNCESYALLYDRIEVREGRNQYYGTQVRYNVNTGKYELLPIQDEGNVDLRRRRFGMESLYKYLLRFEIKYSPSY